MFSIVRLSNAVFFIAAYFTFVPSAHCRVLDVPAEYMLIQTALDASQSGDTVRVAPGTYHEFLESEASPILLTGWYPSDTVEALRTVFDPIPIDLDTPSTLVFTGDSAVVRNISFFYRASLRQYNTPSRTGGVQMFGECLSIENCRFDSVSKAVNGGNVVHATNCAFVGCLYQCIFPVIGGAVKAERCTFDGRGPYLVRCYSESVIRDCHFVRSETQNDLLFFSGANIIVSDCVFGPSVNAFPILRAHVQGSCVISNCQFEGIERSSSIILVTMGCPGPIGTPIRIRGNVFRDYHAIAPAQGTAAIAFGCQDQGAGYFGIVEDNVFEHGSSINQIAPGVTSTGSFNLIGNTFRELSPPSTPDVQPTRSAVDTVIARNNSFLDPGIAAESNGPYFDARENWWGDSTGPNHANLNPEGLGTPVGNGVIFEPWLTMHPDSSEDTTEVAVDERDLLLPNDYALSVYPNPFNATTTLTIEVVKAGIYDVVLYDINGREAARLFSGRIDSRTSLQVNAESFASGVYFARLSHENNEVAAAKLLLLK